MAALVERHRLTVLEDEIAGVEGELPRLAGRASRVKDQIGVQERRSRQLAGAVQKEGGADLAEARFLLQDEMALAAMGWKERIGAQGSGGML